MYFEKKDASDPTFSWNLTDWRICYHHFGTENLGLSMAFGTVPKNADFRHRHHQVFFSISEIQKAGTVLESLGLWQQHMLSSEAVGRIQEHKIPAQCRRGRGGDYFSYSETKPRMKSRDPRTFGRSSKGQDTACRPLN